MATVRLDNLVRPKQINTQQVSVKEETFQGSSYVDLHLDLKMSVAVGTGVRPGVSNDIKVSFDETAIKNSIYNILYTKPGQKVLDPGFGTEIHKFLFEPVSEIRGDALGHYILNNLSKFEPRINIEEVIVNVEADDNLYKITVLYNIPSLNKSGTTDFTLKSNFGNRN
jgi:phage baseplate assembly protein W